MSDSFTFTRVRFSKAADVHLRTLATRTQLRPNVLCRAALAISLEAEGWPQAPDLSEMSSREINRGTLFGNLEGIYLALIRQRREECGQSDDPDEAILAHLHRGVAVLVRKTVGVRSVCELTSRMLE